MAYQKKTWKNRLVEFATRRILTDANTSETQVVEVARSEGTVYQAGDAFSADNMNDLENRIEDEFTSVNENLIAILNDLTEYSSTTAKINYGSANTNIIQKCGNMLNIALNVEFSATSQANNLVTLPKGYRPLHNKYITCGVIRDGGAQANILCVVNTNGNINSVSGSGNITQIYYGGTIPLN